MAIFGWPKFPLPDQLSSEANKTDQCQEAGHSEQVLARPRQTLQAHSLVLYTAGDQPDPVRLYQSAAASIHSRRDKDRTSLPQDLPKQRARGQTRQRNSGQL